MAIIGTSGNDTLVGTIEDDEIEGRGGNDDILGGVGDDSLAGGTGNDVVVGSSGDDSISGGSGDDSLVGGTGFDWLVLDTGTNHGPATTSGGHVDLQANAATDNWGDSDFVVDFENVLGSAYADHLQGDALANLLEGAGGNDTLEGRGGADTLDGGSGLDFAAYSGNHADYTVHADEEAALHEQSTLTGEGADSLVGIERVMFADTNLALDIEGNAGMVAKLMGVLIGGWSVQNGEWVGFGLDAADTGMDFEELAQYGLDHVMGANVSMSTAISIMYFNLTGVVPPQSLVNYFAGLGYSTAELAVLAADTGYNLQNIGYAGLLETGLEYV
ncbi:MAG: hypothetical protein HY854_04285 [Burkholderiales bacterium]|nr:hypothetical protein [Burkholderiales bacterium]